VSARVCVRGQRLIGWRSCWCLDVGVRDRRADAGCRTAERCMGEPGERRRCEARGARMRRGTSGGHGLQTSGARAGDARPARGIGSLRRTREGRRRHEQRRARDRRGGGVEGDQAEGRGDGPRVRGVVRGVVRGGGETRARVEIREAPGGSESGRECGRHCGVQQLESSSTHAVSSYSRLPGAEPVRRGEYRTGRESTQ